MKKLFFLLSVLLCACNKNDNVTPSKKDLLPKSFPSKTNMQNLQINIDNVNQIITYVGNGVYDIQIQCPYDLLRDNNDGWGYTLFKSIDNGPPQLIQEYHDKSRFFEFQATLTPGYWSVVVGYEKFTIDPFLSAPPSFNITAKPADPSVGWVSLYRYFNQYITSYIYTNYWERLGSYNLDYEFQKVQGYLYPIGKDPYTGFTAFPVTPTLAAVYEYFNSTKSDYVLTTTATPPANYVSMAGGPLGVISTIYNSQFNLALNEYVTSTGQHAYISPPETLPLGWTFSKTIGYISSTPYPIVGNNPVTKSFLKTNCAKGYTANISATIIANTFYSDTQANADAAALAYLNANGQIYANAASSSNCVIIAPQNPSQVNFNMKNTTSSNYTLTFSGNGPNTNISLPASTNSLSTMINVGTYTLLISPAGSPTAHHISLGSRGTVTAVGTTFNNVNISPGSTDLNLVIN